MKQLQKIAGRSAILLISIIAFITSGAAQENAVPKETEKAVQYVGSLESELIPDVRELRGAAFAINGAQRK